MNQAWSKPQTRNTLRRLLSAVLVFVGNGGCSEVDPSENELGSSPDAGAPDAAAPEACSLCPTVPLGFPDYAVPADNPLSDAKILLGRRLFYDKRLSGNQRQSCASCHEQKHAFAQPQALPLGSTGHEIPRNSQPLANVAYLPVLTWVNPILQSLESQAKVPLFGDVVVELGASYHQEEILNRFERHPRYLELFKEAFGAENPVTWDNIIAALSSFQRTLISGDTPFDRFVYGGQKDAMSESAKRGLELFNSERLECYHCHEGFNFTTAIRTQLGDSWKDSYVNTGLYNAATLGGYPASNQGLFEITDNPKDIGKFRVPSLRNVGVTAPYMHDGSVESLEEVVDIYARGGRLIEEGELAGDGAKHPGKHPFVVGFTLSEKEKNDLLAFLLALTDESFLEDPRFAAPDPW